MLSKYEVEQLIPVFDLALNLEFYRPQLSLEKIASIVRSDEDLDILQKFLMLIKRAQPQEGTEKKNESAPPQPDNKAPAQPNAKPPTPPAASNPPQAAPPQASPPQSPSKEAPPQAPVKTDQTPAPETKAPPTSSGPTPQPPAAPGPTPSAAGEVAKPASPPASQPGVEEALKHFEERKKITRVPTVPEPSPTVSFTRRQPEIPRPNIPSLQSPSLGGSVVTPSELARGVAETPPDSGPVGSEVEPPPPTSRLESADFVRRESPTHKYNPPALSMQEQLGVALSLVRSAKEGQTEINNDFWNTVKGILVDRKRQLKELGLSGQADSIDYALMRIDLAVRTGNPERIKEALDDVSSVLSDQIRVSDSSRADLYRSPFAKKLRTLDLSKRIYFAQKLLNTQDTATLAKRLQADRDLRVGLKELVFDLKNAFYESGRQDLVETFSSIQSQLSSDNVSELETSLDLLKQNLTPENLGIFVSPDFGGKVENSSVELLRKHIIELDKTTSNITEEARVQILLNRIDQDENGNYMFLIPDYVETRINQLGLDEVNPEYAASLRSLAQTVINSSLPKEDRLVAAKALMDFVRADTSGEIDRGVEEEKVFVEMKKVFEDLVAKHKGDPRKILADLHLNHSDLVKSFLEKRLDDYKKRSPENAEIADKLQSMLADPAAYAEFKKNPDPKILQTMAAIIEDELYAAPPEVKQEALNQATQLSPLGLLALIVGIPLLIGGVIAMGQGQSTMGIMGIVLGGLGFALGDYLSGGQLLGLFPGGASSAPGRSSSAPGGGATGGASQGAVYSWFDTSGSADIDLLKVPTDKLAFALSNKSYTGDERGIYTAIVDLGSLALHNPEINALAGEKAEELGDYFSYQWSWLPAEVKASLVEGTNDPFMRQIRTELKAQYRERFGTDIDYAKLPFQVDFLRSPAFRRRFAEALYKSISEAPVLGPASTKVNSFVKALMKRGWRGRIDQNFAELLHEHFNIELPFFGTSNRSSEQQFNFKGIRPTIDEGPYYM